MLALAFARALPAQSAAMGRSCSVHDPSGPSEADSQEEASEARWAPPLDRLVTTHGADMSLRDALDRVAAIAKLHLSYSTELLPLDRVVCLAAVGTPVGRVLTDLLAGLNVAAVTMGSDQVVLTPHVTSSPKPAESAPSMARSLGVLDRVVVTGSTAGAPQRDLTVGLAEIDGHELARENSGTLSATLDSYVPGIWSWTQSPTSMLTSYASIRGASSFGLSYPKIYIDGIEVANPLLVTRFDPGSIDHVEVIRGPQGSALYGTDAISGVVNIVTRHDGVDADGSHASLRTTAGVTQSDFAHSVLSQDHALSLVTGSSTRSLDLDVSGGSVGDFIPNGYSKDLISSASGRIVGEHSVVNGTARFFAQEAGPAVSPLLQAYQQHLVSPKWGSASAAFDATNAPPIASTPSTPLPQSIREYTLGGNATLTPDERWTNSFVAGIDGYRLNNVQTNVLPIPSVADSALRAAQGGADRVTLRASSAVHFNQDDPTRGSLTFSGEQTTLRETQVMTPPVDPKNRTSTKPDAADDFVSWQNSTGFTTQANGVFRNSLFATGGVRVEHDSRLAGTGETVLLPMVGLAGVNDYGPLSVKLRAAYGKGVRPPSVFDRVGLGQTQLGYPTQASLGPEEQAGTELGLDVYLQHMFTLQVTRFDQRASGLIQQVAVPADSSPMSRRVTYALEDVGEISNRGWEFGATGAVSRLSVAGTFSMVDSRVARLAAGYTGDLLTGDRMLLVPARTASVNLTWTERRWNASLGGSRAMDWINYDELSLAQAFASGDHPARDMLGAQLRQYWREYNGGLRLRATMSREIRDMFSVEVTADNLLNYQRDEPDNITIVPGRTLMTGVRVKF